MKSEAVIRQYDSSHSYIQHMPRQNVFDSRLINQVTDIISLVIDQGDQALVELTRRYDGVHRDSLNVMAIEWQTVRSVTNEKIQLFEQAAQNIRLFHQKEFEQLKDWFLFISNSRVGQKLVPIQRIGIYVPGGTASYPSSVLMNIIPAQVAGVKEIVLVSPPDKQHGSVDPHVLAIAELLGIGEVYAIGGAQAIAALAYGTQTIAAVDKITGPGNRYVAEAKRQVFGRVGIDSIAGPSEIVILADDSANPTFLAADLLSQAEHDEYAQSVLISWHQPTIERTKIELKKQLVSLPRMSIAKTSLQNRGALISVNDVEDGIELINRIAPEHLELHTLNPNSILPEIKHAGAIFIGPFTPEPVGDYWAGSNHILPTSGSARYASALSVRDFLKWISIIEYDQKQLMQDGKKIAQFARLEGLEAHSRAVDYRLSGGNKDDE